MTLVGLCRSPDVSRDPARSRFLCKERSGPRLGVWPPFSLLSVGLTSAQRLLFLTLRLDLDWLPLQTHSPSPFRPSEELRALGWHLTAAPWETGRRRAQEKIPALLPALRFWSTKECSQSEPTRQRGVLWRLGNSENSLGGRINDPETASFRVRHCIKPWKPKHIITFHSAP